MTAIAVLQITGPTCGRKPFSPAGSGGGIACRRHRLWHTSMLPNCDGSVDWQ